MRTVIAIVIVLAAAWTEVPAAPGKPATNRFKLKPGAEGQDLPRLPRRRSRRP